jgi:hypothetical protein
VLQRELHLDSPQQPPASSQHYLAAHSELPISAHYTVEIQSLAESALDPMSTRKFQFIAAEGGSRPPFDLDVAAVHDIGGLKQAIGSDFGVVRPDGNHYQTIIVTQPLLTTIRIIIPWR